MSTKAALAAVLMIALLVPTTTAQARTPLRSACRFQMSDGKAGWSVEEVKRTIRCGVRRWSVPGGLTKAYYIADRESNFYQYATNPSGCRGIYQWLDSTWRNVVPMFPELDRRSSDNVYNARSNVLYAVKYAHHFGWGPWGG